MPNRLHGSYSFELLFLAHFLLFSEEKRRCFCAGLSFVYDPVTVHQCVTRLRVFLIARFGLAKFCRIVLSPEVAVNYAFLYLASR
jgi:hypothetical protein